MRPEELLPDVDQDPRDVRDPFRIDDADEVVYRLGLLAQPVPGLPATIDVDDVSVSFVHGPILAQRTVIRQRHGLPVVFDKCMQRVAVAEGELVALYCIRGPLPEDLAAAFADWRARALAAAGLLAAVLDERIAGPEVLEDAILLAKGEFVGAADMHAQVRSLLPFDVNTSDRAALAQLARVSLSEASAVARAARLYQRAALEGPTADGYAMLWVAAECFSEKRSPSRKEIEAALIAVGLDPETLPIHVGLLIDLRGKIQHHGLEAHDGLKTAFYEMEGVVRSLIRQRANLIGGWWPAADNAAGFADPFDAAVAAMHGPGSTVWHDDGLPTPARDPVAMNLPRRVPDPLSDSRVEVDPDFGDAAGLVAAVVVDAIEWQDPNATLAIRWGAPSHAPDGVTAGANASSVWLAEERLEGVGDPRRPQLLVNFVWDLHGLVAAALAQRAGIASEGDGTAVVQACGAWAQYRRLALFGEFDASLLRMPTDRSPISLGKLAGWAAAGDARAERETRALRGRDRKLAQSIIKGLRETAPGAPTALLGETPTTG